MGKLLKQLLRLINGLFLLIFKNIFYKILVELYYNVFRLKKNSLTKKTINELGRNKLIYLLISGMSIFFIMLNINNSNLVSASENNISKTILAHLISSENEFPAPNPPITEGALSNKTLLALKNSQNFEPDIIEKNSSPLPLENNIKNNLPIFNDENDTIFKPLIIASSTNNFSTKNTALENKHRQNIITYTVQSGNTVSAIARHFGISVNTILWANNLSAYSLIQPGDKLIILPESGILYTVRSGDSLSVLASRYQVKMQDISNANNLDQGLKIGKKIIIPGAKPIHSRYSTPKKIVQKSYSGLSVINNLVKAPTNKVKSSRLLWPTVGHVITQYYSWHHHAIDIANRIGTPLYAAADGKVLISRGGWNGGYGNTILLDNGGGIKTRYAHASKLLVKIGQYVKKGQIIALMGSTGNSTGPHIHFEVIVNGVRRNPLNYVHY